MVDELVFDLIQLVVVEDQGRAGVKEHVQVLKGGLFEVQWLQGILEGAYVDAHSLASRVLAEDVLVLEPVFPLGANADEAHEHDDAVVGA